MLSYKEVVNMFESEILPSVPANDIPWLNEAWNNYTDYLCKSGQITEHAYNNWTYGD